MPSFEFSEDWYPWIFGALFLAVVGFLFFRRTVRHRSLRRTEDGVYVWVEWHGGRCRSMQDPREPGGAWDDGGGDGGGGDGGGGD